MKYVLLLCLTALLSMGCRKDSPAKSGSFYIEKTLRLDTMEFFTIHDPTGLQSATRFKLRSAGVRYPDYYDYELKDGSIYLQRSISSAYFGDVPRYFQWSIDKKSFVIEKFFYRDALPARVEFVWLK